MNPFVHRFAAAAVLGLAVPAFCQLKVVSTFPIDAATAVDTSTTVEFRFSAPVDTAAHFVRPADFFIGFYLYPEPELSRVDSVTISRDMQSVRLHNLHLQRDTRYVCALFGARSLAGEFLQEPFVFTFTTAAKLPTGALSGSIGAPGSSGAGALVLLYTTPFAMKPEAVAAASGPDGIFKFGNVPSGVYWPIAIKDMDRDGSFDPEVDIDLFGAYDPNGDGFSDSLMIADGSELRGIDITLFPYKGISDLRRHREAQSLGANWSADARLVKVMSPSPAVNGISGLWIYLFHSGRRNAYFAVFASNSYLWTFPMECIGSDCRVRRPTLLGSINSSSF